MVDFTINLLLECIQSSITDCMHLGYKLSELDLAQDTTILMVHLLEDHVELAEIILMLCQLVVKDYLDKLSQSNPALSSNLLALGSLLLPRQFFDLLHLIEAIVA